MAALRLKVTTMILIGDEDESSVLFREAQTCIYVFMDRNDIL
jgi:hypothetical protein